MTETGAPRGAGTIGHDARVARVAAIYDIHANLPALDAVLGDVRRAGVDLLVVGGDVVPGPMPRETLSRLMQLDLPVRFIRGNGDREVLERMRGIETESVPPPFREAIRCVAGELDAEHERLLAGWPETLRLEIGDLGEVLFCHATPDSDTKIFTRVTPEVRLEPLFAGLGASLVVCGHTHMQFDRAIGGVRVVNAGSVGMPFGEPGAYWLLLGPAVELRRTSYDLSQAAARIGASGYPQALQFARQNVQHPPSAQEMVARLSRAEV